MEQELNARLVEVLAQQARQVALSGTSRVRQGEPIRYLVPEGVQTYIEKVRLYRNAG